MTNANNSPLHFDAAVLTTKSLYQEHITIQCLYQRIATLEAQLREQQEARATLTREIERERAEREQMEQELRDSNDRYMLAVRGTNDGLWDWNMRTGEIFLSQRWHDILGYQMGELPAGVDAFYSLIHPNDAPVVNTALSAHLQDGTLYNPEFRMRASDGSYCWILARGQAVWNGHGQPVRMAGSMTDISDRKQAEAALADINANLEQIIADQTTELRHNQAIIQGLLDNSPAVIFVKDLDGRLLLVNRHYAEAIRMSPEDIIGKTDAELFSAGTVNLWQENHQRLLETGEAFQVENTVCIDGHEYTFFSVLFPLHNSAGAMYAVGGIVTDITERKQVEQERAALQEQIIAAQQATLRELSTPLLPIAEQVVVMPLIGSIDSGRAQAVLETLLDGVSTHAAQIVILDITGVAVVDTSVANALIRAAQAVALLGAQVVLTGMQPRIAQTLVTLGVDLRSIITRSTLRDGIAYALRQQPPRPRRC